MRGRRLLVALAVLCMIGATLVVAFGKPVYRRIEARLSPSPPEIVVTGTVVQVAGREYLVWLPKQPKNAPILLVLHGAARGAERFAQATGLVPAATARGYAVIAPLGISRRAGGMRNWNAGHCCSYAFIAKSDDAAFLDAVLADATARFGVDPGALYVAGFSSGGMTGLRYALTRPGRVTAVASVSGTPDPALMPPDAPVPMLMIYGDDDEVIYFPGGFVADEEVGPGGGYQVMGVEKAAAEWAAAMGATDNPAERRVATRWLLPLVTERNWTGNGALAVRLMILHGGKHVWPGGAEAPDAGISGTDEVLRFFAEQGGPGVSTK